MPQRRKNQVLSRWQTTDPHTTLLADDPLTEEHVIHQCRVANPLRRLVVEPGRLRNDSPIGDRRIHVGRPKFNMDFMGQLISIFIENLAGKMTVQRVPDTSLEYPRSVTRSQRALRIDCRISPLR